MPKRKKKLEQSASLSFGRGRVTTGASLYDSLRGLVNGLFGKKAPYLPDIQEIADYHLTPREREVAYLAALGFGNQEIADALGMNFQAVQLHMKRIMGKMQVNNPRELREYFVEHVKEKVTDSRD